MAAELLKSRIVVLQITKMKTSNTTIIIGEISYPKNLIHNVSRIFPNICEKLGGHICCFTYNENSILLMSLGNIEQHILSCDS